MNTSQLLLVSSLGLAVNLFGMFAMGGHHHHVCFSLSSSQAEYLSTWRVGIPIHTDILTILTKGITLDTLMGQCRHLYSRIAIAIANYRDLAIHTLSQLLWCHHMWIPIHTLSPRRLPQVLTPIRTRLRHRHTCQRIVMIIRMMPTLHMDTIMANMITIILTHTPLIPARRMHTLMTIMTMSIPLIPLLRRLAGRIILTPCQQLAVRKGRWTDMVILPNAALVDLQYPSNWLLQSTRRCEHHFRLRWWHLWLQATLLGTTITIRSIMIRNIHLTSMIHRMLIHNMRGIVITCGAYSYTSWRSVLIIPRLGKAKTSFSYIRIP